MTRDEIVNLIREEYDPKPTHWKASERGWDDGAERIADKILLAESQLAEAWNETALHYAKNAEYYRGLVVQIGDMFGQTAYTSDDGSIQQDVLCAKVPELVLSLFGEFFDPIKFVSRFQEKFGIEYRGKPRVLPEDLSEFRLRFMHEELLEYAEHADSAAKELSQPSLLIDQANLTFHLGEMLDALVDLTYVVLGTAHLHGFDFREAFRRVHTANMLKIKAVRNEQSTRGSGAHDVIKPVGWEPPNHSDLVEDHIHQSAPTGG